MTYNQNYFLFWWQSSELPILGPAHNQCEATDVSILDFDQKSDTLTTELFRTAYILFTL